MTTNLLLQDLFVAIALWAGLWLFSLSVTRKLNEKMDTLKVRSITRNFLVTGSILMGLLVASGVLSQLGILKGIPAYAVTGVLAVLTLIRLQVFRRLGR